MWLLPEKKEFNPIQSAKIISLVPSLTELLIDCGLENQIVGRTKFCIHPHKIVSHIPKVGGTKNINFQSISAQKPDIILANKEENTKKEIEILAKEYPVYLSDISTIQDLIVFIEDFRKYIPKMDAELIVENLKKMPDLHIFNGQRVIYLIWQNPMMAVGSGTFIHYVLEAAGFKNVFSLQSRYPEISVEQINRYQPNYIFLSSEPYPFQQKHVASFNKLFPDVQTVLVDGEMFSWYGSRTLKLYKYLQKLKITLNL
ncbi:MAG: ABC transporter substrate-binding protein [Saprospiraceae bacterium]|nr:ABC transporter substrate-binding protein [Saprospiraceae bacterium]